ncbi:neuralized-like protein 4 [Papilio machaon]|uniref:neuralized-like protein 4 n=1 Tax=Papilio machaon TaxID=76193 RepID=UPI001E662C20|nr:neuralized-like protein 4 [Papilio machaon]
MRFHRRCGDRVTLLHNNYTAVRNFVEFNHGLVLSDQPLKNDVMFEVCIDRKVNVWNGSLEIGVTTQNPEYMDLPATATKLRNTAWILSGSSVVRDGVTHLPSYGPELDTLQEGDCVGVMRTSRAELLFFINGRCLGVAAMDMPPLLYGVIDLYGQCVQITLVPQSPTTPRSAITNAESQNEATRHDGPVALMEVVNYEPSVDTFPKGSRDEYVNNSTEASCTQYNQDRLRFHTRCGVLVRFSHHNRTAERARPMDDYNDAVVMTSRPLHDGELFEIRIERLVHKWSGSIEVGVTNHNPATLNFPSTMTNMETGTVMLSGSKVLINGQGTCTEYGSMNLDELKEGDMVGLMRKSCGSLHYFINGVDQGVAARDVAAPVWGVVDLYGMTSKVSIVDAYDDSNLHDISPLPSVSVLAGLNELAPEIDMDADIDTDTNDIEDDSHLFHTMRASNVVIINNGKTAYRPNAMEFFNEGLVMTNRPLKNDELFQVRVDVIVPKWAGSIEIGVTQHTSNEIQFPYKLSNAKSGTWALVGEDVIRDGVIISSQYTRNLNRLVEGDTIGLMRTSLGVLHFYINGEDQGPAAYNVPDQIYGIIDLYGRAGQVSIVEGRVDPPVYSPESPLSTESIITSFPEMCFHLVHGRNAVLSRSRLTASRAAVYSEFNDAVLFSSRPLRECDMFELRIDAMVDCWIGSIEMGVTGIRPEDLESGAGGALAGTATDLTGDTYVLSGAAVMKDGECVRSGYRLDLDTLSVGSRVGMMWHADRSLHYYLDGMDMGQAWHVPHLNIYAVVDLYGQCTQVTILQNEARTFNYNPGTASDNSLLDMTQQPAAPPQPYCTFSEYCGDNVRVTKEYSIATRFLPDPAGAIVFSSSHLAQDEMFEVKILKQRAGFAGGLRVGVTDVNILNAHVNRSLPPAIIYLPHFTAYIDGKHMFYSRPGSRERDARLVVPSFEWLRPGDRIGLKLTADHRVVVYYNYEPLEVAFEGVPDKVYAVIELHGEVSKIQAMNKMTANALPPHLNESFMRREVETFQEVTSLKPCEDMDGSMEGIEGTPALSPAPPAPTAPPAIPAIPAHRNPRPYTFHNVHGNNIKLCSSDTVAVRTTSYNGGLAVVSQPIRRGQSFMFRVDKVDPTWSGSVGVGALGYLPDELPDLAGAIDPPAWLLAPDLCADNGIYFRGEAGRALEEVSERSVVSVEFLCDGRLVAAADGRPLCALGLVPDTLDVLYPLVDVYGKVCQVSILLHPYVLGSGASLDLPSVTATREDSSGVSELPEDDVSPVDLDAGTSVAKPKLRAHSHSGLAEELAAATRRPRVGGPAATTMHHSLMLPPPARERMHKSHSSHSLGEARRHAYADDPFAERHLCDTNIRHNDRYPEASEVDNLDIEIVDALTLETGNLPDLTEDHSSSIDDSTRRDDLCTDMLSAENVHYLSSLLGLERGGGGECEPSEWERAVGGRDCAHLALVLDYWRCLLQPLPELRRGCAWGRAECHCSGCHPDLRPPLAGWVRIERADAAGGAARAYWPLSRAALAGVRSCCARARRPRRPTALTPSLSRLPASLYDVWFDVQGTPHRVALALEIDVEGKTPESDCMLAVLIYMKPHSTLADSPCGLEE